MKTINSSLASSCIIVVCCTLLLACSDSDTDSEQNINKVKPLDNIVQIDSGELYTLALKSDGTVWGWGNNYSAQLGHDPAELSVSPRAIQIPGLTHIKSVSAGHIHALALNEDGIVYSWGDNSRAQLGDRANPQDLNHFAMPRVEPYWITIGEPIVFISAGMDHNLAITDKGEVYSWGYNRMDLGYVSDNLRVTKPTKIPNLSNIQFAHAGQSLSAVIDSNGELYGWGDIALIGRAFGLSPNDKVGFPQLIDGIATPLRSLRGLRYFFAINSNDHTVDISGGKTVLTDFTNIKSAEYCYDGTIFLLTNNGNLLGYGNNSSGLFGDNILQRDPSNFVSFDVSNLLDFQIGGYFADLGEEFIAVLDDNGHVWSWGGNSYGQLGNNSLEAKQSASLVLTQQ